MGDSSKLGPQTKFSVYPQSIRTHPRNAPIFIAPSFLPPSPTPGHPTKEAFSVLGCQFSVTTDVDFPDK
jgi:hypothetical protein